MDGDTPLWLTLVLGSVPIVTALIAALFAQINSTDKKIERLSKLVNLREKVSEPINPNSTLDKIILCEMWSVERATDPDYRLLRRRVVQAAVVLIFPYMYLIADNSGLVARSPRPVHWLTFALLFVVGSWVWFRWSGTMNAKHKRMKQKYRTAIAALTKPPVESPVPGGQPDGEQQ